MRNSIMNMILVVLFLIGLSAILILPCDQTLPPQDWLDKHSVEEKWEQEDFDRAYSIITEDFTNPKNPDDTTFGIRTEAIYQIGDHLTIQPEYQTTMIPLLQDLSDPSFDYRIRAAGLTVLGTLGADIKMFEEDRNEMVVKTYRWWVYGEEIEMPTFD